MTHYREGYREALAGELERDPAFAGFRREMAWAQRIDTSQLPVFGVATPRESCARAGGTTVHRVTTVQVALKIAGGADLEGALDTLSLALERCALGALRDLAHIVELSSTSSSVDAGGEKRTGVLIMEFAVTRFTDAASQD